MQPVVEGSSPGAGRKGAVPNPRCAATCSAGIPLPDSVSGATPKCFDRTVGNAHICLVVIQYLVEVWEGFQIALRALFSNKLRSFLTMLGIIIGIVTVTAMLTVIGGLERGLERSLGMLGMDVLYVEKMPWIRTPQDWVTLRNRPDIRPEVADAIRDRANHVAAVAPSVATSRPVRYRDRAMYGVYIEGSTPDATRISDVNLTSGRWYNELEVQKSNNVAVIGADVAEVLFPSEQPLGKRIRIHGHRFEVIGVLQRQGKFMGLFSFDEQIQIPFSTFQRLFGRYRSITVEVKAASVESLELAEDEITGIVRAVRGVDAMEESDFEINKVEAFRERIAGVKATIYAIGIFLTALSLLVGGIGVMNIMFVTVKERTKEIGIRKAVGANRNAILVQFLIEAVLVCMVAGLIGVGISLGVSAIINSFLPAYLSPFTVGLAFAICVGVGIVFGIVPSWNAAGLRPIDALRYE